MPYTFPAYFPIYPVEEVNRPTLRGSRIATGPDTRRTIGIQQFPRNLILQWEPYPFTDANAITQFLEARLRGNQWFYWTRQGDIARKWRCRTWSAQSVGRSLLSVRAAFSETFEVTS